MTTKKKSNSVRPRNPRGRIKNALLDAYDKSMGNISATCRKVNISRETFYRYKREDPVFAERIHEINESNLDFAESVLLKNIREGKEASLIFYLKTQGKERGYVEKVENEVSFHPFLELMRKASTD